MEEADERPLMSLDGALEILADVHLIDLSSETWGISIGATPSRYSPGHVYYAEAWGVVRNYLLKVHPR